MLEIFEIIREIGNNSNSLYSNLDFIHKNFLGDLTHAALLRIGYVPRT